MFWWCSLFRARETEPRLWGSGSLQPFQGCDPGSTPGERIFFLNFFFSRGPGGGVGWGGLPPKWSRKIGGGVLSTLEKKGVFPCPRDCCVTGWPSGLRRQIKALFRKGVGSNPTADNFLLEEKKFLFSFFSSFLGSDSPEGGHFGPGSPGIR